MRHPLACESVTWLRAEEKRSIIINFTLVPRVDETGPFLPRFFPFPTVARRNLVNMVEANIVEYSSLDLELILGGSEKRVLTGEIGIQC